MSARMATRILCFGASLVEGFTKSGQLFTPYAKWMKESLEVQWPDRSFEVEVDGKSGDQVVAGRFLARMQDRCDSLTEGYSMYGSMFTPYSSQLKPALSHLDLDVVTEGQSGDVVVGGSFMRRMQERYSSSTTRRPLYDWVVILGGTNDLAWGRSSEDIYDGLVNVSNIPLENGAKVLLLTVPECHVKIKSLDERRDALNDLIKSDQRNNVCHLDLHASIPYHSMDVEERNDIWDDGLHFSPTGYEKMGKLVAARLNELISGDA